VVEVPFFCRQYYWTNLKREEMNREKCRSCGREFRAKDKMIRAVKTALHYECAKKDAESFRLNEGETVILQTVLEADYSEQERYAKILGAPREIMLECIDDGIKRYGCQATPEEATKYKATWIADDGTVTGSNTALKVLWGCLLLHCIILGSLQENKT
jgi:hypothetical protein